MKNIKFKDSLYAALVSDNKDEINKLFLDLVLKVNDRRRHFSYFKKALNECNPILALEIIKKTKLKEEFSFIAMPDLEKYCEHNPRLLMHRPHKDFRGKSFKEIKDLISEKISLKELGKFFYREGVSGLNYLYTYSLVTNDSKYLYRVLHDRFNMSMNLQGPRALEKLRFYKNLVTEEKFYNSIQSCNASRSLTIIHKFLNLIKNQSEEDFKIITRDLKKSKRQFHQDATRVREYYAAMEMKFDNKKYAVEGLDNLKNEPIGIFKADIIDNSSLLAQSWWELNNCLLDYQERLERQECVLVVLRERGKIKYCAEFRKKGSDYRLTQLKGKHNSDELEEKKKYKDIREGLLAKLNPHVAKENLESLDFVARNFRNRADRFPDQGWGRARRGAFWREGLQEGIQDELDLNQEQVETFKRINEEKLRMLARAIRRNANIDHNHFMFDEFIKTLSLHLRVVQFNQTQREYFILRYAHRARLNRRFVRDSIEQEELNQEEVRNGITQTLNQREETGEQCNFSSWVARRESNRGVNNGEQLDFLSAEEIGEGLRELRERLDSEDIPF